jgi:hypothetical protein
LQLQAAPVQQLPQRHQAQGQGRPWLVQNFALSLQKQPSPAPRRLFSPGSPPVTQLHWF